MGVEGVLREVHVDVVRRAADAVRADREHDLRVAALVHQAGLGVELVQAPATGHVPGLVRHDVADRKISGPAGPTTLRGAALTRRVDDLLDLVQLPLSLREAIPTNCPEGTSRGLRTHPVTIDVTWSWTSETRLANCRSGRARASLGANG
jgi:predicted methyltransferase MtxX (methanogen marker protein 4)